MVTLRLHGWLREDETREPTRYGQDETPMNRVENKRTRLNAEEAARRDFARRLGTYSDASTRILCACGLTMGRKAFQEHQEQTHHEQNRRTGKDAEHGIDVSVDS